MIHIRKALDLKKHPPSGPQELGCHLSLERDGNSASSWTTEGRSLLQEREANIIPRQFPGWRNKSSEILQRLDGYRVQGTGWDGPWIQGPLR